VVVLTLLRGLRWIAVHSALAGFVAIQILTSALNVQAWPAGLRFVSVYVLGFACFALATECSANPQGRWAQQRRTQAQGGLLQSGRHEAGQPGRADWRPIVTALPPKFPKVLKTDSVDEWLKRLEAVGGPCLAHQDRG
jgi:hypothetical protein